MSTKTLKIMNPLEEIQKAGNEVANAGQKVINDWVFKYDQKDLTRYNDTNFPKDAYGLKKIKNLREYVRPNYMDENLKSMLAQETLLLTEEFINASISNADLFNTGNKQLNDINRYNVRNYAQKKLYDSNIKRYKDNIYFNKF